MGVSACTSVLAAAAMRAMWGLLARCKSMEKSTIQLRVSLFEYIVAPILTYCSEVWGPTVLSPCNTVQKCLGLALQRPLFVLLRRLGGNLRRGTSNQLLMREFGAKPLARAWLRASVKLWNRAVALPDTDPVARALLENVTMAYRPSRLWSVGLEQVLHRIQALPEGGLRPVDGQGGLAQLDEAHVLGCFDTWFLSGYRDLPPDPRSAPSSQVTLCTYERWFAVDAIEDNYQVLRLNGLPLLPPAVSRLPQLKELSLERLGHLDRQAVSHLAACKQLTALTVVTAAEHPQSIAAQLMILAAGAGPAFAQHQGNEGAQHNEPGSAAAAAAASAAEGLRGRNAAVAAGEWSLWLPLLGLPHLQELVLGSAYHSQQLKLTGSLSQELHGRCCTAAGGSSGPEASSRLGQGGDSCGGCGGCSDGYGGGSTAAGDGWYDRGDEGVSAYVCPTGAWSDISRVQGLHNMVVVRSWHSAAVTAAFPTFAAAVASFLAWPQPPQPPASPPPSSPSTVSAVPLGVVGGLPPNTQRGAASQGLVTPSVTTFDWQRVGWCNPAQWWPQAAPGATAAQATATAGGSSTGAGRGTRAPDGAAACYAGLRAGDGGGAVGVFYNHPNQGCFLPELPQLLVLALRPRMGGLGGLQRQVVGQLLQMAASRQPRHVVEGQVTQLMQGVVAGPGAPSPLSDSTARCLLLAQLRSSMHHSKLLLVLGASATALTRLELTVDQSWPASVLASLGHLASLRRLSVLKLDCGRQQPVEEMWTGLSRLTTLRWLCLRWLDRLPLAPLAPLTQLAVLQLKNIDKPPGVAALAEVLCGMPQLTALSIEGALLDADEDWLRDMAGLMRHGRWTSSWVEHVLCREYRLRVLGSITAAFLMSAVLNSPKPPEMVMSAFLAAISGGIFIMAVTASLLQLLLDPQQLKQAGAAVGQHDTSLSGNQQVDNSSSGSSSSGKFTESNGISSISINSSMVSIGSQVLLRAIWAIACVQQWLRFWLLGGGLSAVARRLYSCLPEHPLGGNIPPGQAGGAANGSSAAEQSSSSSSSGSSSGNGGSDLTVLGLLLRGLAGHLSLQAGPGSRQARVTNLVRGSRGGAGAAAGGVVSRSSSSSSSDGRQGVGAGGINAAATQAEQACAHGGMTAADGAATAVAASGSAVLTETETGAEGVLGGAGTGKGDSNSSSSSSSTAAVVDPGSAFRRLRFLSLRRCTLSHSSNSVSNKLWQLSVLASQLAPGAGAQIIAVTLAIVLWPLAVAAAISRIAASSGSFSTAASSSGGGGSGGSDGYSRRSRFAAWAWGWDLLCGLLQGAANRVEGVAAGCGPVVAVAGHMPELRYLDLTWLNLEPWELHAVVQLRQLHYLGLSRQQVGVVMSREAVFARNCSRSYRQHRRTPAGAAAVGVGAAAGVRAGEAGRSDGSGRGWSWGVVGWLLAPLWFWLRWLVWLWPFSRLFGSGNSSTQQQAELWGARCVGGRVVDSGDEWPGMMLIESPSGFDDVIEREMA